MQYLLVAIGSALGGAGRFGLSQLVFRLVGGVFPWGTLLVNVTGCLAIGLFATVTAPDGRWPMAGEWRLFVMTGLCGGYTTFSAFSLQTLTLAQDGELIAAAANVICSVGLCLLAVWLGHFVASQINHA